MLDHALTMYQVSVESLRNSDTGEMKQDVYSLDQRINSYERDVRKKVTTHLSITGSTDLVSGLVLLSVIVDIERIGDYSKNICDLAREHPKRLRAGSLERDLTQVETIVGILFYQMVDAFKASDEKLALQVMKEYKRDVSGVCDQITHRIVSGEIIDLNVSDGASVAMYGRYLKRIAAHSRNIITSVVNPFHRIHYEPKTDSNLEPS